MDRSNGNVKTFNNTSHRVFFGRNLMDSNRTYLFIGMLVSTPPPPSSPNPAMLTHALTPRFRKLAARRD